MFVLDGLRKVRGAKMFIPQFHLGHLGFVPGLEVYCRAGRLDPRGSQELTLTPFQGHRNDLFLLKCVFQEQVGVVLKALSAFASLKLNVLSLESATINNGKKHVLYCILSWDTSPYNNPVPLDDATQHKFVQLLHLLPTADARYLVLLETLFLFCGDALDTEEIASRRLLPRVHMKLFDALQEQDSPWQSVKVDVDRAKPAKPPKSPSMPPTQPKVFFDLSKMIGGLGRSTTGETEAILLSETETKTLRLIFPGPGRAGRFLHIAFHHANRPGALLAIATLLSYLGFNILTSLLRKVDHENNVWETMLELSDVAKTGKSIERIAPGIQGVDWFKEWAFNEDNRRVCQTADLIRYMIAYNVRVSRPSYPRQSGSNDADFQPQDILSNSDMQLGVVPENMGVTLAEFNMRMQDLQKMETSASSGWLAALVRDDLRRRCIHEPHKGTVFVSLPSHCRAHLKLIEASFRSLHIEVDSYIEQNSEDVAATALAKIRRADFFFALWHPDRTRLDNVSPWMPFEYGAARSLGKKRLMIFHSDLSIDIKRRLDPSMSWMEYDDLTFSATLQRVVEQCRQNWLSAWEELTIDIKAPTLPQTSLRTSWDDISI